MIGKKISRYKILEKLGQGGMGVVYKALDTRLQRTVSIKMLPPEFAVDESRKGRLLREARAASALNHPNICTIYDIDESDGSMFLVMEYLNGRTLREELESGPLRVDRALQIASEIGDALHKVHQLKIIHRDIKPSNIMISEEGHAKILDFGLASVETTIEGEAFSKIVTIERSIVEEGKIAGTLRYMSPEQIRGEDLDFRSDVFSFGIVLYETLTGHSPFQRSTVLALVSAILNEEPEPFSMTSGIPNALERIIRKALAKKSEERYQSMQELLADLKNVTNSSETSVAVLYFENLSGAKEEEYFRDGMTEDIITELWKIKNLKVFPRSAVLGYRNAQVQAVRVGQELNATHVLEGSVRRSGNRIRISGELVETATGHALWASRIDRELKDIFEVQDEIACSIAQALRVTLTPQEEKEIALKPTANTEAYDYYLRGRSYARRRTRLDLESALEMYEGAIALDPHFALAYAGIGHVCGEFYFWYGTDPKFVNRGLEVCERALTLVPNLPEGLAARSIILYGLQKYDEAIRDARKAVKTKPDCPDGYWALGCSLFATDHLNEAASIAHEAIENSADDDNVFVPFVMALERLGRSQDALELRQKHIQALKRQLELAPDDVRARILVANNYAVIGRTEEALAQMEKAMAMRPEDSLILYNAACTYALLGKKKETLELLKNLKGIIPNQDWMSRDPDFEILRGDPEFEDVIRPQINTDQQEF
jgi:serine/threonine protein kinase/Flp pilus assembly protein TadD